MRGILVMLFFILRSQAGRIFEVLDSISDDQSKDELSVNEIELFSEVLLDILRIISRVRPEPKMQIL